METPNIENTNTQTPNVESEMVAKYLKLAQQRKNANKKYYHTHTQLVAQKSKAKYDANKETICARRKELYNLKKDDPEFKAKNCANTKKQYLKKKELGALLIEQYISDI